ncbi:MAG: hypothetical protein QM621_08675 [Aeromicrobium sp.]|uniref:hypothetical protein n=1 Tax=Aeromicrobium sp. TaxID=1871063 RepID=UPI0039E3B893
MTVVGAHRAPAGWLRDVLAEPRNRAWLYAVAEAVVYALVGVGVVNQQYGLALIGLLGPVLGLARRHTDDAGDGGGT